MEFISKPYYIFKKYENYDVEELERILNNINPASNYDYTLYSVIKTMISRFNNGNFKNPYIKPIIHDDVIY